MRRRRRRKTKSNGSSFLFSQAILHTVLWPPQHDRPTTWFSVKSVLQSNYLELYVSVECGLLGRYSWDGQKERGRERETIVIYNLRVVLKDEWPRVQDHLRCGFIYFLSSRTRYFFSIAERCLNCLGERERERRYYFRRSLISVCGPPPSWTQWASRAGGGAAAG